MNLSLILELTKRDFTEKYSGSVLGLSWTFIWPLVNIFIYIVIFAKIMGARLPGSSSTFSYGIYLVSGLVPWTAFANTITRIATVFVDKKGYISKIRMSLPFLPIHIVLTETIIFAISYAVFFLFLLVMKHPFNIYIFCLPIVFVIQQIFAYSLGFFIAVFHVFIRDLREVVGIIMQIWFWFTPIVYVIDILPDLAKSVFVLNPAYHFIRAYQEVIMLGRAPDWKSLALIVVLGNLFILIGAFCFNRLEKDIRDFI